jgi:hypothetical protein
VTKQERKSLKNESRPDTPQCQTHYITTSILKNVKKSKSGRNLLEFVSTYHSDYPLQRCSQRGISTSSALPSTSSSNTNSSSGSPRHTRSSISIQITQVGVPASANASPSCRMALKESFLPPCKLVGYNLKSKAPGLIPFTWQFQ